MDIDIPALITEVGFPIIALGYLLFVVARKVEKVLQEQILTNVYLTLLLAQNGVTVGDPMLAVAIKQYLDSKKDNKDKEK